MKKDEMRINDTLHKLEDAFDEHWNSTVCKDSSCIFTSEPMKKILKAHDASLRQSLVKEVVDKIEAELCAYTPSGTKFYPIKNLEEWNKLKLKIILQEKE